jgi:hypothetical protein
VLHAFEWTHWLCFYLEFEHGDHDPDEACGDPSIVVSRGRRH